MEMATAVSGIAGAAVGILAFVLVIYLIAFAAERARLEGRVIDVDAFEKEFGLKSYAKLDVPCTTVCGFLPIIQ